MTIAVAVKTSSAMVFAADSKTTTAGIAGLEQDGAPRWVEQTYDNATKVVCDRSKTLMAMAAGYANVGRVAATDFISTKTFGLVVGENAAEQDRRIRDFVAELVVQKRAYWETTQVDPSQWTGPTLLLAAPSPADASPRLWRVDLNGPDSTVEEILQNPGIRLEGTYNAAFGVLYGYEPDVLRGIGTEVGVPYDRLLEATGKLTVLRPMDKMNLWTMPIQDAIDLAFFLANHQEQMDRFLPGTPACGGPIDVMVLQMAPDPGIVSFPGKVLHHPGQ